MRTPDIASKRLDEAYKRLVGNPVPQDYFLRNQRVHDAMGHDEYQAFTES